MKESHWLSHTPYYLFCSSPVFFFFFSLMAPPCITKNLEVIFNYSLSYSTCSLSAYVLCSPVKMYAGEIPGDPVARSWCFHCWAHVRSLVGELKYDKLHGAAHTPPPPLKNSIPSSDHVLLCLLLPSGLNHCSHSPG